MQKFEFNKTKFDGVYFIKPFKMDDERGSFIKDYSYETFKENGIDYILKEVFYTVSKKGVIRALHFQEVVQQPKLIRCIKGKVFDVIVDLRKNSPTLGEWISIELSEENTNEVLIPAGFGHGYLVLEDAIVSYKCTEKFYGDYDTGIMWNDEDINIKWPLETIEEIILSEKDKNLQSFQNYLNELK